MTRIHGIGQSELVLLLVVDVERVDCEALGETATVVEAWRDWLEWLST